MLGLRIVSILLLLIACNESLADDLDTLCPKNACSIETIEIEEANGMRPYSLIVRPYDCYWDIDTESCEYSFYIQDEYKNLTMVSADFFGGVKDSVSKTAIRVYIDQILLGSYRRPPWIVGYSREHLYEKIIRKERNLFCVLYKMKSPFSGKVKICSGGKDYISNSIGYASNVLSLSDAENKACNYVSEFMKQKCEHNELYLYKIDLAISNGIVMYRFLFQRTLTPDPNPNPCV